LLRLIEVVSEGTHSADVPLTMGEVKVLLAENLKPSGRPDGGGVRGHLVAAAYIKLIISVWTVITVESIITEP
jgi:hypothetical protein